MKRTLILRAECLIDITRFLHNCFYANEAKWISNEPSYSVCGNVLKLDVENDELGLSYFRNMAANVVDGHVMVQTMSFGPSYTARNYMDYTCSKLTFDVKLSDGK